MVVTGGAHGIGRALCKRFAAEGARAVVVADVEMKAAREVAADIGSHFARGLHFDISDDYGPCALGRESLA